jgi:hypothetical protein
MNPDFKWVPAAKTDISKRIKEEWLKLGQVPPSEDPVVQQRRKEVLEFGRSYEE